MSTQQSRLRYRSLGIGLCMILLAGAAAKAFQPAQPDHNPREMMLYIAPEGRGDRTGQSPDSAAALADAGVWDQVQQKLQDGPVTVTFLDGDYQCLPHVLLKGIGHENHLLTLQGESPRGAVFRKHPEDPAERPMLFVLEGCRNMLIRHLNFTGEAVVGYAFNIRAGSRDIVVDECTWIDLTGAHFGAAGTASTGTRDIIFRNCTFERIGYGGHSHAIYNAYGPQRIHVLNNRFEDCAGDYVRFRDRTDWCVVTGNRFESTGEFLNAGPPKVVVPLFNSRGPGHPEERYETFGTNFLIFDNEFIYPQGESTGHNFAIMFYHKGFDPPERNHLMTAEEGRVLREGTAEQRKALLWNNCRIDTDRVRVHNNTYVNQRMKAAIGSWDGYGSPSAEWQGYVEIYDLLNEGPISEQELAAFGLSSDLEPIPPAGNE
jgi:hypothetical protein